MRDHHVPVSADVYAIDVIFVKEKDDEIKPLGVKGVGGGLGTSGLLWRHLRWPRCEELADEAAQSNQSLHRNSLLTGKLTGDFADLDIAP